jgi:hypothetical protein
MTSTATTDAPKSKKSAFSFLAWWVTDPAEIDKQVAGYTSLKPWQSARGTASLLCVFTVVVTTLLGSFLQMSTGEIATEATIWLAVALFMYRGHRWAFVMGMILWTIEKAMLLFGSTSARAPIVQIIWWTIYLNAFFLAFKVESRRTALSRASAR